MAKQSLLEGVIAALEKSEIRDLKQWLRSPFFNRREDVIVLFDWLSTPAMLAKSFPSKEIIFEKIYPNQPYDAQQTRLLMSWLYQHIKNYFAYAEFAQREHTQFVFLIKRFKKQNLTKHIQQSINEAAEALQKQPLRHADFYFEQFQLHRETFKLKQIAPRNTELQLQPLSDNLDVFYFIHKLRLSCIMLSHQTMFQKHYHYPLLDEILQLLSHQNLTYYPVVALYHHCYFALRYEDDTHFECCYAILTQHTNLLPPEELHDLYLLLINYCIKRLNDGNLVYAKHGLQLYKEALQQALLLENGYLSRFAYRNIVAMGLLEKEYVFIEKFLYDYKDLLEEAHRESTFSFNLARLEYSRRRYKQALKLLQKSDYTDLLLNLAAKTLLLKIYYETNEFDTLDTHLQAMQKFISRHRIMGYHKANYRNVVQLTHRLINTNLFDVEEKKKLINDVQQTDPLTERDWLLEMIAFSK
ncbi:MAG: hypothetical protein KA974_10520 [Saprospiraceae bacterium]|nr:hypothetical protein [Saprospiraceae bacterium]MBP7699070.1 hypothetical protein [Saprospiraceae bacterium]